MVASESSERRRSKPPSATTVRPKLLAFPGTEQKAGVQRLERFLAAALTGQTARPTMSATMPRTVLPLGAQPEWPNGTRLGEIDIPIDNGPAGKRSRAALVEPRPISQQTTPGGRTPNVAALGFLAFLRQCTPRETETCGIILELKKFGAAM